MLNKNKILKIKEDLTAKGLVEDDMFVFAKGLQNGNAFQRQIYSSMKPFVLTYADNTLNIFPFKKDEIDESGKKSIKAPDLVSITKIFDLTTLGMANYYDFEYANGTKDRFQVTFVFKKQIKKILEKF